MKSEALALDSRHAAGSNRVANAVFATAALAIIPLGITVSLNGSKLNQEVRK